MTPTVCATQACGDSSMVRALTYHAKGPWFHSRRIIFFHLPFLLFLFTLLSFFCSLSFIPSYFSLLCFFFSSCMLQVIVIFRYALTVLLSTSARTTCAPNSCSHMCAVVDGQDSCFCPVGLELAGDNITCQGTEIYTTAMAVKGALSCMC